MSLLKKIFLSWVAGLIISPIIKEILNASWKFSWGFGLAMAIILTVYSIADYYGLIKDIADWFKEVFGR